MNLYSGNKKAGLELHITVMMGYPWETREDAIATVRLAREMFKEGYIDTLQAIPRYSHV